MVNRLRCLAVWLVLSVAVRGENPAPEPTSETAPETASEDIGATLARQESLRDYFGGRYTPEWIKSWRRKREAVFGKAGLDFSVAYDSLVLAGLGGGERLFAGSGELSLTGNWAIAGKKRGLPLDLHFRVRNRSAYGDRAPAALAGDLGALWGVVDGFSDSGFEIPEFYIKHRIENRGIETRIGQLSMESQLDVHALRGAKQSFLNRAFSSNPAVAFPRFGAGATLHWKHASGFDFTVGATTVQATTTGDQVDLEFGSSDLFEAIQFGYNFAGRGGDPARVQAMAWSSDAIDEENLPGGSGVALTFEQELKASQARVFLRYAWADDEASDLANLVAGGFGKTCREFDLFGVALGAGQSSRTGGDWQLVIETFYRWQIAAELHITPDIQMLIGDGFTGGGNVRLIPGIRGRLAF